MSEEHGYHEPGQDEVVHEYDDIQEYDNALPLWWLVTFFGTVIFAIGYFFTYQTFKAADLPNGAFDKEVAVQRAAEAERIKAAGNITGDSIGPNLTDKSWLHGGKPENIYKTVNEGVLTKGMAAWGPVLGTDKTQSVVAYVLTLKDTNVAGGKPAQGVEEP